MSSTHFKATNRADELCTLAGLRHGLGSSCVGGVGGEVEHHNITKASDVPGHLRKVGLVQESQ